MSQPFTAMKVVMEEIKKELNGEQMEIGDQFVYALNDGVIFVEMEQGRELMVKVVLADMPLKHLNVNIGL